MRKTWSCLAVVLAACARQSQPARPSAGEATAGIDSLNAALVHAYRTHDLLAYAALYTDTAVFEWPAFNTVRCPAELAAMARSNSALERQGRTRFCSGAGFPSWRGWTCVLFKRVTTM